MPNYTYKCDRCDDVVNEFRPAKERDFIRLCGKPEMAPGGGTFLCPGQMQRLLPNMMEPTIMETVDGYRNVKHRRDQDRRLRDRAKKFFRDNEMEELIEKHGEEQSRRMGWIRKDGKKNKRDD